MASSAQCVGQVFLFSEQVISDEWPVEGEDISLSPRHQALAL